MIDGIDQLLKLYGSEESFVKAFVESSLFIPPEMVRERNEELVDLYFSKGKFPVRYSKDFNDLFNIKNKDEGVKLTKDNEIEYDEQFKILIDGDGNRHVRNILKEKLNHIISGGQKSTIKNYIISHVWGKASHPLFFTSLWNIVLLPAHLNYLMDKDDESHKLVKTVKDSIKQKCIALYDPYKELFEKINLEQYREMFTANKKDLFQTQFISKETFTIDSEIIEISEKEKEILKDLLDRMGNKFFIDYYESYMEGKDLMRIISIKKDYTYNSIKTRITTMKRIFNEGLNRKALLYIIEKGDMRLKSETIERAKELLTI